MKALKLSLPLILIGSVLLLSGVSSGNKEHQNRPRAHNSGSKGQADPSPSPFTIIVQPAPVQIVQSSPTVEKEKPAQKWYQRPTITDWGIFFVTLLYTGIALGLLKATWNQARLTREALVTDKRAFIYADVFMQFHELDPASGLYNWRFRPRWRNAGETATKGATMYVQCEVRNEPLPLGYNFPTDEKSIIQAFVGPKADMYGSAAPRGDSTTAITPEDIAAIQEGRKLIYLWGWMKYKDAFPKTPQHISHFCWLIGVTGNPRTYIPNTPGTPPTPHTMLFQNLIHAEGNYAD